MKKENLNLKTEIDSKAAAQVKENCDEKLTSYKKSILNLAESQDKALAEKLKALIEGSLSSNIKINKVNVNGTEENVQIANAVNATMKQDDTVLKKAPIEPIKDLNVN